MKNSKGLKKQNVRNITTAYGEQSENFPVEFDFMLN